MPLRYFKCHTLPYPSYDVSAVPGSATDRLAISWKNGPPGQAEATQTDIRITYDFDTANPSVVTAAGTATNYVATLGGASGLTVKVEVRRQNSAGIGDYSSPVLGVVA